MNDTELNVIILMIGLACIGLGWLVVRGKNREIERLTTENTTLRAELKKAKDKIDDLVYQARVLRGALDAAKDKQEQDDEAHNDQLNER